MSEHADGVISCPRCSYQNPIGVHHCGMCGFVPPRASEETVMVLAEGRPGTAPFRRPSTDRIQRPGTAAFRAPTDRTTKCATTVDQPPVTDRLTRTTPSAGAPVLPTEIVVMRRVEQRRKIISTVYSTGRLIRHALVGVIALAAICVVRESAYTLTAFTTAFQNSDAAEVALFCLVFGLPVGFITAWHGGGAFRGLFVAGSLFAIEPLLIGWFMGPGRFAAWSYKDLVAGLLAGFCVGLFIEIDR